MTKEEEMKQILNHMPNAYETSKSIKSKQPELADIAWWEMSQQRASLEVVLSPAPSLASSTEPALAALWTPAPPPSVPEPAARR